jgi:Fe-S oxidoreductase
VLLWPDTFNDHFHPDTARAAVEVLEAAGYRVVVPEAWLCCGRPLYDYGMLGLAERHLRQILHVLHEPIRSGVPIVVLEPSCAAVFRDELRNLLPRDENAFRLSHQTFLLSEFLEQKAADFQVPRLPRKAIVHGHCHHKAVMGMDAEKGLLERIGLDYTLLDSGCCGMAGAFGFEPGDHYQVSIAAGERVLLPAVRAADRVTLIVANGFSCREQIAQTTGRHAMHLAEVLQLAMRQTDGWSVTGQDRATAEVPYQDADSGVRLPREPVEPRRGAADPLALSSRRAGPGAPGPQP